MSVKLKEDILKMRFEDVYPRFTNKELDARTCADILNMSERTFLRKRRRYESEGFDGRFDLRIGMKSNYAAADEEVEYITKLYDERYQGFTVKHFYSLVKSDPQVKRSYNWCRTTLQKRGLLKKSSRGGPHRQRRERKPMEGMMLHQDGSTHAWIPALDFNIDLIVTMDDATSEIVSGFLVEQEGTESSLQGVKETIVKKGLFCSFYSDRGSHYAHTPVAGGKVDKSNPTQFGRALRELGIRHIHAYSPQARGRSERMFGTLQGRLPKEFAMKGINSIEEANKYLQAEYWPRHNQEFSVKPKDNTSSYTQWLLKESLDEVLCIKDERVVNNDNTVHYERLVLQIPPQQHRQHYVRCDVEVRKYLNKTIGIFYGHICLGRYDQCGNLLTTEIEAKVTVQSLATQ